MPNDPPDITVTSSVLDTPTRDAHGRPIPGTKGAGQPFLVDIQGPNGKVVAKVTDNNDGSYLVTYTLGWADTYHIEVYINGIKLEDSPFTIVASDK